MQIISLLFNFSVPRTHPCRYSARLAYTVPPISPTPLLTDPPSPCRSAAGCTKTKTFPALYPRSWTVYEEPDPALKIVCRQISSVIPHNYKESSYPFIQIINTASKDFTLLFTWVNSIGGQSEFTGHHFNSKIKRPDGVHGVLLHHKTANEQSLLTFAIAAEKTEYVHISECPVFVIAGSHKGISAKDMWHEVK
ncbi:unnamed protein product [Vicia faba]|uniref:Glycosyl-hydrolase family 116 N-terminal domain-containing protein n=1 Tax=Vicia faba TaxID=3906 RepID=A0AAV1A1H3_VICFA|nr:unnamed protein product [Vicia faba]